jgi:hypothetical protein
MIDDSVENVTWEDARQQQARNEISELKARYCRFLDCKQWQNYAEVFAADGCMQFGPSLEEGAANGREEIVRLLKRQLRQAQTAHHVHPAEFKFHDNGQVSALWPMDDRVANPGFVLEGSGYYEEHYRQIDGRWYIQHMRLHRLRVDIIPTSWWRPSAVGMRLVLLMQKTGLLKLLSPAASKTLAQAQATGIEEDLFA